MRAYEVLVKQVKAEIELKQKEIQKIYQDKANLDQQIDHLMETLEREQIEVSLQKAFFNPKYFERLSNKIKAYRHILTTKDQEISQRQEEIFALFGTRKKYETLLKKWQNRVIAEHNKKEASFLEDIFKPKSE